MPREKLSLRHYCDCVCPKNPISRKTDLQYQSIVLETLALTDGSGHLSFLSLARPQSANAFDAAMVAELTSAFLEIAADKKCRVLFLCGSGKNFCGGADLAGMKAAANVSRDANYADSKNLSAMFSGLSRLTIPSVAVIHGSAYGGGVGLAAACDIAIANSEARFALSEVRLGLVPAVIWPYLQRKLTPRFLHYYALTGEVFSAKEAAKIGLVNHQFSQAELLAGVLKIANAVLRAGPDAVQTLKQKLLPSSAAIADDSYAMLIADVRAKEEAAKGLSSFFAKQPPPWCGSVTDECISRGLRRMSLFATS